MDYGIIDLLHATSTISEGDVLHICVTDEVVSYNPDPLECAALVDFLQSEDMTPIGIIATKAVIEQKALIQDALHNHADQSAVLAFVATNNLERLYHALRANADKDSPVVAVLPSLIVSNFVSRNGIY